MVAELELAERDTASRFKKGKLLTEREEALLREHERALTRRIDNFNEFRFLHAMWFVVLWAVWYAWRAFSQDGFKSGLGSLAVSAVVFIVALAILIVESQTFEPRRKKSLEEGRQAVRIRLGGHHNARREELALAKTREELRAAREALALTEGLSDKE